MKMLMFVAVFGLAGLLAACGESGTSGGGDPIVGTWKVDLDWARKQGAPEDMLRAAPLMTWTYKADGTASMTGPKEGDVKVLETTTGTWKKAGDGYDVTFDGDPGHLQLDGNTLVLPAGDGSPEMHFVRA